MSNTRILKAMIECHLSSAKILEAALRDIEREGEDRQKISDQAARRDASIERERDAAALEAQSQRSMLTMKEASELLKIGKSTLYARVKDGTLPIVKIGCATRIRRSDLERFVGGSWR